MPVIKVRVIPNARNDRVFIEGASIRAYVTAPASNGRANRALIALLANFYQVKKGDIKIIRGEKSREKVVEIVV